VILVLCGIHVGSEELVKVLFTTQIAWTLYNKGKKVGTQDQDGELCRPSISRMINLEGKDVHQCSAGWVPVYTDKDK